MACDIDQRLAPLCQELYLAKQAEDTAKRARIAVEEKIAALVETGENGSKTVDSGVMKVTVKRALSYEVDDISSFSSQFPEFVKTIPPKLEIDAKAYESARAGDTELFRLASAHVAVKPKKVSVTLKV